MLVTLLGMVTDVKPEQPEKAPSAMPVMLVVMTVFKQPDISSFVLVSMMALQLSRES